VAEAGNWLIPVLSVIADSGSADLAVTYVGLEGSTHHLQLLRTSQDPMLADVISPCDIYVDAKTFIPTKLIYNLHPPANLQARIPAEVTYSDWRTVGGLAIPFDIKYSVRGHVLTEYQIQSFAINVGISEDAFSIR